MQSELAPQEALPSAKEEPDGTRPQVGRWSPVRRVTPYRVFSAVLLLIMVPICFTLPWVGDLGLHAAVIERLRTHLLHPGNPLLKVPGHSPYYTPYMVSLGVLSKVTGLSAISTLKVAALGNLVLLLTGVRAFVRMLTRNPWAPVLAFLFYLLLWGATLVEWSGYFPLVSLALCVSYPSTFATAVMFHLWALVGRAVGYGSAAPRSNLLVQAGIAVLTAVIMLSHQFTAIGAILGMASIVISRWATLTVRKILGWLAVGAGALAVILLWPYYSLFSLASSMNGLDEIHRILYLDLWGWYGFALVGLPALVARWRRDRLDPLVVFFVLASLLVAYGWFSGHYAWGRAWPMVLLGPQFALGIELAGEGSRMFRRIMAVPTAVAVAAGCWTQAGVLLYDLPANDFPAAFTKNVEHDTSWGHYGWIKPYVKRGDVVLSQESVALKMAPSQGVYTVAPAWPDPLLPVSEQDQRWNDTAAFFSSDLSRDQRTAILRKYHVKWIIKGPGEGPVPAGDSMYRQVAQSARGERLVKVTL